MDYADNRLHDSTINGVLLINKNMFKRKLYTIPIYYRKRNKRCYLVSIESIMPKSHCYKEIRILIFVKAVKNANRKTVFFC